MEEEAKKKEKRASDAFWKLLKDTTGVVRKSRSICSEGCVEVEIESNEKVFVDFVKGVGDRAEWRNEKREYESGPSELDNPVVQSMAIANFERKLADFDSEWKEPTKETRDTLTWSDEVEQLVVKLKANARFGRPKLWSDSKLQKQFRTLRMLRCNIDTVDAGMRRFVRLTDLSLSLNRVASLNLRHLPPSIRMLNMYDNALHRVYWEDDGTSDSTAIKDNQRQCSNVLGLGLGFNRISDASFISRHFPSVRILDLSYNSLCSLSDIVGCLRPLAHLEHLKLMGNPCTLSPSYKSFVASELSSLIELDGIPCDDLRKVKSTGTTIENASNMKENIVQFHVRVDRVQQTRVADHLSDAIGAFEANRKTLAAKREDGRAMTKIDVRQIIRESKESVACAFELEFSFARAAWTSGEIGTETDPKKNVVHSKSIERVTPTVDVRDSIVAPGLVCTLYEIASMTASTPILETTCDVDHDKEKKEEEEKDLETTTDVATGNTNDAKEDTVVESTDAKEEEPRRVRRRLATGSVDTSKFIDADCTKISDTLSFRTDDVDWVAWIASEKFARLPEDEIASDIRDACACASYSCEVTIEISYG